jgi:hypothetical protein
VQSSTEEEEEDNDENESSLGSDFLSSSKAARSDRSEHENALLNEVLATRRAVEEVREAIAARAEGGYIVFMLWCYIVAVAEGKATVLPLRWSTATLGKGNLVHLSGFHAS